MKMASRSIYFILLIVTTSLIIGECEGGWKFWKKKKDQDPSTTTLAPGVSGEPAVISATTAAPGKPSSVGGKQEANKNVPASPSPTPARVPNSRGGSSSGSPTTAAPTGGTRGAIAGAAKPAIAVGAPQSGVRNGAPNPGTEVGRDIVEPRPPAGSGTGATNGKNYRDWAADLTGAGEPAPRPKTPTQPPINTISTVRPTTPAVGQGSQDRNSGLATTASQLRPIAVTTSKPPTPSPGGPQVSTLHVGPLNPGQVRPGQPTPNTGGKSWAEVAGNGGKPTATAGSLPSPARSGLAAGGAAIAAGGLAATAAGTKTYSANPTFSKGYTVTDDDLEKLSEALFIKDTNNANKFITLNLQKVTTSSNTADQAPQPLMTVNAQAYQIGTIAKLLTIYDNYKLDSRVGEYISPAQRTEESLLVDTFLSTNLMSMAMRFLADKSLIRKDYYEYKDTLRKLWFNLYSRGGDGKIGSSGFEHVFMTELKLGTEVSGLHNWIYFNAEEVAKRADYLGYIKKVDLGDKAAILKLHAKYNNIDKPVTTMFIGTSPELEMALYTVCFLTRKDLPCPVSLGGTKFNIVTHKFRYRGNDLIGSAYPDI